MLPPFFSSGHRAQRGGLNRNLQQLLNTNVPGFPAFLGSAVFRNCGLPQSNVMLKVTNGSLRDGGGCEPIGSGKHKTGSLGRGSDESCAYERLNPSQ